MALTKDKTTGRFVKTNFDISKGCLECGNRFECKYGISSIQFDKRLFCSRQCSSKNQQGKLKLPHSEEWKINNSIRHTGKINSIETRRKMSVTKLGENNPNWKGGVSTEYQLQRASMNCKVWREAIFKRDEFKCQDCSKKGGWNKDEKRQIVLNAHHIKSFLWFPELRFAIDNGVTLCEECHRKTDNYGARAHKIISNGVVL